MKPLLLSTTYLLGVLTIPLPSPAQAPAAPVPATNAPAPRIQFASTVFDFGRAPEGEIVRHDFVFTNTGNAMLTISGVHGSCNCTTAGEWTREVPPGETGIIPLQFNTTRFPGTMVKTAMVIHNDPSQPAFQLQLKGTVWRTFDVMPQTLVMNIPSDSVSNATAVVRIVNNLDEPVTVEPPQCNNRSFTAELGTVKPGKEFQVVVTAVPPFQPGVTQGSLTLKTSATNSPLLQVMVMAVVQHPVIITPQQIVLPPNHASAYAVTVINNSANPLTLSDLNVVNAEGVHAELKEVEPGKRFTIMLNFPPAFAASTNQIELTFKTSHPQYPSVRVPVRRLQAPARIPRPAPPAAVTNAAAQPTFAR
jgi:hypothetical protein